MVSNTYVGRQARREVDGICIQRYLDTHLNLPLQVMIGRSSLSIRDSGLSGARTGEVKGGFFSEVGCSPTYLLPTYVALPSLFLLSPMLCAALTGRIPTLI